MRREGRERSCGSKSEAREALAIGSFDLYLAEGPAENPTGKRRVGYRPLQHRTRRQTALEPLDRQRACAGVMSPNSRPTFPGEVQGGYKDRKARAHNRRRRAWYLRPAPSPFSARCYSLRSEGHRRGRRRGRSAVEGRKERAVPLGSRSFASLWGRGWKYPLIVGKMLGRTNDLREFWP